MGPSAGQVTMALRDHFPKLKLGGAAILEPIWLGSGPWIYPGLAPQILNRSGPDR